MCDICVINSVKNKMLSRRSFLKTGAVGAAATVAGAAIGTPAMAAGHGTVEDMTHTLHEDFPTFFGESQFSREQIFNYAEHSFNLQQFTVNEHTGTHVDAPLHFSADGASVDEIPVSSLIAPLCVIDIAARASKDADTQVTPDDIAAWIAVNGDIPDGACVAMHSGWGPKVDTDGFRNFDGKVQHYPGFHAEAAAMLLETGAQSIAVDTLSLDHGMSPDFATHYAWLPSGRFGIECLANLDKVPASGATLVIGAPKHRGGTGGPARIFAMI
ncbi:cyclase family protein [Granulosicoccus antarcticus]|uniref:Kynurenine formamidase n=1 Tax=Granulosicoccus antarcticus IMCC3135 TaxID=1192854 RepID=A0A2Z2NXM1_9GAMM|nr:cyclase family protein [Granulosicoccus antarcticus]ASJ76192.1 Kynurenine formamidase [Granulosicoccus antarcticus IMCC3135]